MLLRQGLECDGVIDQSDDRRARSRNRSINRRARWSISSSTAESASEAGSRARRFRTSSRSSANPGRRASIAFSSRPLRSWRIDSQPFAGPVLPSVADPASVIPRSALRETHTGAPRGCARLPAACQIWLAQALHFDASRTFGSLQKGQVLTSAGGGSLMNIRETHHTTKAMAMKAMIALMNAP
jgi:hypothetical protein